MGEPGCNVGRHLPPIGDADHDSALADASIESPPEPNHDRMGILGRTTLLQKDAAGQQRHRDNSAGPAKEGVQSRG